MIDEIFALADRGLNIIPVAFGTKDRPLVPWKERQEKPLTKDELSACFPPGVLRNAAILTGVASGVVMVDVDSEEALNGLPPLPVTPAVKTERGWHFYFKHPGIPVSNPIGLRAKIDIRADGGYGIIPPSVNANGVPYEWLTTFDQASPAPMPEWLIEALRERKSDKGKPSPERRSGTRYGTKALQAECSILAGLKEGERNASLNLSACKMGNLIAGGQLDRAEASEGLVQGCADNGLLFDERSGGRAAVLRTIESGFREGFKTPRYPESPSIVPEQGRSLIIRRASDIKPEKITWLWEGMLAQGAIAFLAGDPGLGKSTVALDIAAIVSRGGSWPVSGRPTEVVPVV
jgi:Bifunctional DNA primase/polymerase, N-terminal/AAA domain